MNIDLSVLTSLIYGSLVLIWGLILALYVTKFIRTRIYNKTVSMLVFILAIDAFRTLFESAYFGLYFSKSYESITNSIIFQPAFLIFPKLLNLAAAILIIFLLIRHWIPRFIIEESNIKNQLNVAELRFNVTVKYSPNPILVHAEDGEILSISDKLIELTGYAREDLKTLRNWTNKAYRHNAREALNKIISFYKNDNSINIGEILIYANNDKVLYWEMHSISLGQLDDGRKVRMVTATDVTDKKALLSRLFLIEHSINHITDSVIWFSAQGNVVNHNQFAEEQLGYSSEEFANLNINSLELRLETPWHDLWQKLSISNILTLDSSVTTKAGKILPISLSAHYLEFKDEQYLFMIIHDVSDTVLAERHISESEDRRRFALDAANIGDWDMDLKTNIARRSLIHDQCFGYETPVKEWGYDTFLSHVAYMDRERVNAFYKKAMTGGGNYDVEFRVVWPDNSTHWLWSKGRFYFDDAGKPIRVSGILGDITQNKAGEMALRLNKSAIESSTVGVVIVDALQPDMPIVYVNPTFEKMTGYHESEVLGKNCRFLNNDVRDEEKLSQIRTALVNEENIEIELQNTKKDGSLFWNLLNISPIKDNVEKLTHFVGIQMDITERKKAEVEFQVMNEKIRHLAYYDSLTGLPNRVLLNQYLQGLIDSSSKIKMSYALFLMDVDNFKNINDTFGHDMGDMFLKEFAIRLNSILEDKSFNCRFGGDEFILVMSDQEENSVQLFERAKIKADKILSTMNVPFRLGDLEFFSSVSMGINFVHSDLNINKAIKRVDLAMYQAKKLGKNNIQIFDERFEKEVIHKTNLEKHLRAALDSGEFELHYQPQIDSDNKIFGCEALIRWQSRDLGRYVSPADFIPVAEETALILPIGKWVLESACQVLYKWGKLKHLKNITVSVNISTIQFKNSDFITLLEKTLQSYPFNRKNLKLELTETMLADDVELMITSMNKIKKMGLAISLDDFGTGYSSLSYLKTFPINQLKIDQSFVRDILTDNNDALIAESIIKLAQILKLEIIAEGVETEGQRECLINLGCNQFQGYLFSKALCLSDLEKYINDFSILES